MHEAPVAYACGSLTLTLRLSLVEHFCRDDVGAAARTAYWGTSNIRRQMIFR
jgi:hypothetical protein